MVTTAIYRHRNPPTSGAFIDARVNLDTSSAGVVMSPLLELQLMTLATKEEIAALKLAMLNSATSNRLSSVYARSVEKSLDIHGVEGLKEQVACMLLYLGDWNGADARACKAVLRKFSK